MIFDRFESFHIMYSTRGFVLAQISSLLREKNVIESWTNVCIILCNVMTDYGTVTVFRGIQLNLMAQIIKDALIKCT
jgi:hypothetical protein